MEATSRSREEEGNGCWMPDPAQFVQKRIKVEGVGIKMVQDLTMDDFLRWVRLRVTFFFFSENLLQITFKEL